MKPLEQSTSRNRQYLAFRRAVLTSQARQIVGEPSTSGVVEFLRLPLQRLPQPETVKVLLDRCLRRSANRIYFVNAHTVVMSRKEPALEETLNRGDLLLPDGSGVLWSSRLLGKPIKFNLNGTDLIPALCKAGAPKGLSVYLLGAKPGVADDVAQSLTQTHPGLTIAGIQHGYFEEQDLEAVLDDIRQAQPHVVLVAMGVPLQEFWIDQHAKHLPGITLIGVGGLFDFLAQRVVRAPYPVRRLGLEWCWRLMMEPSRLGHRYTVGIVAFIYIVLQDSLLAFKRKQNIATQQ